MFNWKEFEKIKNILSLSGNAYYEEKGFHHINIRPVELLKWVDLIKNDLGYFTLIDIVCVQNQNPDFEFEVIYQLLNMGTHQRIILHLFSNRNEIIPSINSFYAFADWAEREQAELYALKFDRELKPLLTIKEELALPKTRTNPNRSETPYQEEIYEWKKFGLLDPATCGNFEAVICFDPKKIVDSQIQIGFYHLGLEEMLTQKSWFQITQLIDRFNLSSGPTYSLLWVKTLEDLMRIKIPERAQAIRIVILELARIAEHLTVMYEICASVGQDEARYFIDAREKISELFEKYCGDRQGVGVAKLGGVKEDLPHGWIIEFQELANLLQKNLNVLHLALISRKKFREKLKGPNVTAATVLEWGVSGPAMRAAGVNFDLRKSRPIYFYQDIDFDIPVGIHGTSYDRYLIRYEEILQSLRITIQVLDNLPLGEVINPLFNKSFFELNHFLNEQDFDKSWQYSCFEAPTGEAGLFFLPANDFSPKRLKIKSPSFSLTQALPKFLNGLEENQVHTCIASLGIRRAELER
ncbi:MAG: NADH-quinone oxidoreductase subunit C [Bacteriovoracaceae bacterium]